MYDADFSKYKQKKLAENEGQQDELEVGIESDQTYRCKKMASTLYRELSAFAPWGAPNVGNGR